jgi:hypothetical protein
MEEYKEVQKRCGGRAGPRFKESQSSDKEHAEGVECDAGADSAGKISCTARPRHARISLFGDGMDLLAPNTCYETPEGDRQHNDKTSCGIDI